MDAELVEAFLPPELAEAAAAVKANLKEKRWHHTLCVCRHGHKILITQHGLFAGIHL